jgi:hypothetical protein
MSMNNDKESPESGSHRAGNLIPALISFIAFLVLICAGYRGSTILFTLSFLSIVLVVAAVEKRLLPVKMKPQAAPVDEESQPSAPVNFGGIVGMAFLLVLAVIIIGNMLPTRSGRGYGQLTACKSNLKNLATALEMYNCDNNGRYPQSLAIITPSYIKVIPTCPSAGVTTYAYYFSIKPDAYTMCCSGAWHKSIISKPDFPRYDSFQGLIERP